MTLFPQWTLRTLAVLASCLVAIDTGAQANEAADLFDDGRALMLEGRFEQACPKLEQSQELEPRVGTLLNLAVCHERIGMIATAWVEFQEARDAAIKEGRPKQAELAQKRIDILGPKIPWVTITVAEDTSGLAVALDGTPVDPNRWGEPVPIDPGDHILVGAAPGHAPRETTFEIGEAEQKSIVVARLDPLPTSVPKPTASQPSPKPLRVEPPTPIPQATPRWVLELGVFGGYMLVEGLTTSPDVSEDTIELTTPAGEITTCAVVGCDYGRQPSHGGTTGITLFAGYAATDWFHIGGRFLLGLRLGGGVFFAAGPSALFHVGGPLWLGGGAVLGTAAATGTGSVRAVDNATPVQSTLEVSSSIDLGPGPMAEVAFQIATWNRGALTLHTTPLLLAGNGTAVVVPITAAFRFQ